MTNPPPSVETLNEQAIKQTPARPYCLIEPMPVCARCGHLEIAHKPACGVFNMFKGGSGCSCLAFVKADG